jgi:hypothetical protein
LLVHSFQRFENGQQHALPTVEMGRIMKNKITELTKVLFASAALLVGMAAFTPTGAFAAEHNGGRGYGGGHGGGFSGGQSFSGGGSYGGHGYHGGRGYEGGRGSGSSYYGGGRYYGGRNYYAPRYYSGGFGLGFYAGPSYGYAAPVCSPSGFYDHGGYWHYYRGCAAPVPYGY